MPALNCGSPFFPPPLLFHRADITSPIRSSDSAAFSFAPRLERGSYSWSQINYNEHLSTSPFALIADCPSLATCESTWQKRTTYISFILIFPDFLLPTHFIRPSPNSPRSSLGIKIFSPSRILPSIYSKQCRLPLRIYFLKFSSRPSPVPLVRKNSYDKN